MCPKKSFKSSPVKVQIKYSYIILNITKIFLYFITYSYKYSDLILNINKSFYLYYTFKMLLFHKNFKNG